jgi:hypothetical protein
VGGGGGDDGPRITERNTINPLGNEPQFLSKKTNTALQTAKALILKKKLNFENYINMIL